MDHEIRAEVRATGRTTIVPGGVSAAAQSAATLNARLPDNAEKTTLADILKVLRDDNNAESKIGSMALLMHSEVGETALTSAKIVSVYISLLLRFLPAAWGDGFID
ncbi:hypothetical protein K1719_039108 [Acacia pycnantha]|nr:hypothetical protein K1719_039108 [Acacia pycnantha]